MSSLNYFQMISTPSAVSNPISGMIKDQGIHHLPENSALSDRDVRRMIHNSRTSASISMSIEQSDKESAALALSALAGSKRTHSPTCVTEPNAYALFASSTPSNHRPSDPSCSLKTMEDSPEAKNSHGLMDTMRTSSSSVSVAITPTDRSKRVKVSTEMANAAGSFESRRFSVPTPPLPGARKDSSSAFVRGPFTEMNQHQVQQLHTSMSADGNQGVASFMDKFQVKISNTSD
jgi:hypothetical protein